MPIPSRTASRCFDLKAEEFEVFEDGVSQKIETFEHVVVRPAGPQSERAEVELPTRVAAGGRQSAGTASSSSSSTRRT